MKNFGYYLFKLWISAGLFCYYRKINVKGLEQVPIHRPVLFLSNHQNALMDVLILATRCNRRPWFLTRSDVFANSFLRSVFGFLQMIPIYRIRDGKENLPKNQAVFDRCSQLLSQNGAILIFPEANHNLQRRVRPLSKGFTRIVDRTMNNYPETQLYLTPVGQNYQRPTQMGDSAALFFGKPILVRSGQYGDRASELKMAVFDSLKNLTTHITAENYGFTMADLKKQEVNFLNPEEVNNYVNGRVGTLTSTASKGFKPARCLFYLINLPMVFLWRILVRPKVPEPEFMATFRFGFSMLFYPVFYLLLAFVLTFTFGLSTALPIVVAHFFLSLFLIKNGMIN